MKEVRLRAYAEDGVLKVAVDRIDREERVFETLDPDGTWRKVGLYQPNPGGVFSISKTQTDNILKSLS